MSAMVPAPTAWTDAEAPPPRMRMTMSMAMLALRADRTEKTVKRVKETM
jgi:hypothetical protein